MKEYREFLKSKHVRTTQIGFEIPEHKLNKNLFPWQRDVVRWAIKRGRAGLFEDCGLGKSFQQLEFAAAIFREERLDCLLLCPPLVAHQTLSEAAKFGVDCPVQIAASQDDVGRGINITNYEKLHKFDVTKFGTVVLDESSILKNFTSVTKRQLCNLFKRTKYKLACTATPSPNDRMELGNHSEFLSIMPSREMLQRWFINDTMKAGGYRLAKHAKSDFWRWVASWAMAISTPEDIGHDGSNYKLPPLNIVDHTVDTNAAPEGFLFDVGGNVSATTVHQEKRRSIDAKLEIVDRLVNMDGKKDCWAVWCDTDYEADALIRVLPDAVEIRGSHRDKIKEERLAAFTDGQARVIITKPEIGGFGLNWQHCHNTTYFAGFSFERWYQSIRRLWRFGQTQQVNVHMIASVGESNVVDTLNRKQHDYTEMSREMAEAMKDGMLCELYGNLPLREYTAEKQIVLPSWLHTHSDLVA